MSSKKKYSQKDYERDQKKLLKIKTGLEKVKENNPKLKELVKQKGEPRVDAMIKLNAMNSLIGFLVRKGHDSGLPMQILIDIANDYEKRLKE